MSLIAVRNLSQTYGDHTVLERINLEVAEQEFCAIVGASGCGKSTFLRLLLSEEKPSRGEIHLDGAPLADEPTADRGVVFQRYSVFPHLTVMENLILPLEIRSSRLLGRLFGAQRRATKDKAEHLLERVGLSHVRDAYPKTLSGGMQQRLAIAQAIISKPKVLLLDEPFGALDPGTRARMHEIILALWQEEKMTVFMVTHDLKEGFKLGTRLLVFDKLRWDPHAPEAYGATITYDLPLDDRRSLPPELIEAASNEEPPHKPIFGNEGPRDVLH
ncbi:ABC transporter ATP-binding protein [Pelagibius litoralis]|uniref:ABC transporter ATP-binding protein n=1 Tax=Pelagibius litoralis TaxID=374515 RepID=A0A967KBU9_9PROT|nr:ABC transporter ATP-binding protein [Pelagibius litoralis]NIA69330.1 ABC transporter ATP-binding protein [Pelagibius litoralis]